ncbi:MAG: Rieske (2Fe-2S) protein [Parvularculaceae bacterium]
MSGYVKVAEASALGEGENKAVDVDGVDVLLCNTKEGYFAVENRCTHQLTALEGGKIRGCFIFCPLHGQRFSLKDGAPIGQLTDKPIRTFPVKVEDGAVFVSPSPAAVGAQD